MRDAPIIALIAGEASGDLLGSRLICALKRRYPNARFVGIGGAQMIAEGMQSRFPLESLSVMGAAEVIRHLPELLKIRRTMLAELQQLRPDVFVGIDAPDFNIPVELKLKAAGIPTVHYVSPSVWAWRPKRVFKIAKATHRVLALLPFEKAFYDKHQVPCDFVGHPLADEIPLRSDRDSACRALGLDPSQRYIALLPGSRRNEVKLLAEPFLRAAELMAQQQPELGFCIPVANAHRRAQLEALLDTLQLNIPVTLFDGRAREVMTAADGIMLASGTATLEAMLVKRPMIVAYRMSPISHWLAMRLVKLEHFSLPNLLARRALVPELLQDEVTPTRLAAALNEQIAQGEVLNDTFTALHQSIRRDASEQAATAVSEVMEAHSAC